MSDEQLRRALEASLKSAEEEKRRRSAGTGAAEDAAMRAAIEASRRDAAAQQRELERQRAAAQRPSPAPVPTGGGGGQLSEAEQLRRILELSAAEAKKAKQQQMSTSQREAAELKKAIENSMKTKAEEDARRAEEMKQLRFALQLSAAMYKANQVSVNVAGGDVEAKEVKQYEVPIVHGDLQCTVETARGLPDLGGGSRLDPYVVLRVLTIAPVGTLEVTVHEARDLRKTQSLGKQDPYVILSMDRKRLCKGKVHDDGGTAPVWNETFNVELTGSEKDNSLEIQIWNKNMMADAQVGYAYLSISDILTDTKRKWVNVAKRKGNEFATGFHGQILVSWKFNARGAPDFKELHRVESKVSRLRGINPKWNQILNFRNLYSSCYVQATVRDKRMLRKDGIVAISKVISVQGAIHRNFFSKGKDLWYQLGPSEESQRVVRNEDAGMIELKLKFITPTRPEGIEPVEVASRKVTPGGEYVGSVRGYVARALAPPIYFLIFIHFWWRWVLEISHFLGGGGGSGHLLRRLPVVHGEPLRRNDLPLVRGDVISEAVVAQPLT